MSKLWRYKGYLIHAAAVAIAFLAPAVHALVQAHPAYSAIATVAYGWLLHWANGK